MTQDDVRELLEDFIGGQQQLIADHLRGFVQNGTPYALVDFPDYSNVGDSAIWVGQITMLHRLTGRPPAYVCGGVDEYDRAELLARCPKGPIFIQGGGNFGDIWPHHQELRHRILIDFPERTIIQLPQSISFSESETLRRSREVINAHTYFHLIVRDNRSLEFAKQNYSCETALLPDMAFCMPLLPSPGPAQYKTLFLLRTDKEAAGAQGSALKGFSEAIYTDWLDEPARPLQWLRRKEKYMPFRGDHMERRLRLFNQLSGVRLARGVKMLSEPERVVTDRLHVHILCTLLGVPHIILDNNYAKVQSYHKAWTWGVGDVLALQSASEVATALRAGWPKQSAMAL